MAENTTSNKDRLKEITDGIEQGIKELFTSGKYMQYLRTMSRFHRYSVNNTMLIYMQRPDATLVAGFNKWRDQFSRNVLKGEKGIKIIAPTPFKKKIEQEKVDPQTKAPMLNPDGTVATEEVEIKIPLYKVVSVFDVVQTDGKPLPTLAENLTGDVQQYEIFMEALRRASPVPLVFAKLSPELDGFFNETDQRITIRDDMSEVQTVCAAVHEIAHSKLHNKELPEVKEQWKLVMVSDGGTKKDHAGCFDSKAEAEATAEAQGWKHTDENSFEWRLEVEEDTFTADFVKKSRNTEEVEAESVSYAVCAYYGIPTGENSFGYIATWSKDKELSELRASLETINKTSSGLISDIDRNFAQIAKERGIDLSAQEQDAPAPPETPEPGILYQTHTNPRSEGEHDRSFIQAYAKVDGVLIPGEVIGVGAAELCIGLTNRLNSKDIQPGQAKTELVQPSVAASPEPLAADSYPMPDPALTVADRDAYGYTEDDMLPVSKDKAIGLYEKDFTIYMLYDDNSEGMAFDRDDIGGHIGMFGINHEEWEEGLEYLSLIEGHEVTQKELENNFLNNPADAFAIYQLKHMEETRDLRFEPLERLQAVGLTVERDNYDLIYTDRLADPGSTSVKLNALWERFNIDHLADFKGQSLSVSDIVALKQNGAVSCHYVDSFGFKELPAFLCPDNHLKSAEMAMEDDYGMIDGVINNGKNPSVAELEAQVKADGRISLSDLARAVNSGRMEKRLSVLEQLKIPPVKQERHKTAPLRGAEMER